MCERRASARLRLRSDQVRTRPEPFTWSGVRVRRTEPAPATAPARFCQFNNPGAISRWLHATEQVSYRPSIGRSATVRRCEGSDTRAWSGHGFSRVLERVEQKWELRFCARNAQAGIQSTNSTIEPIAPDRRRAAQALKFSFSPGLGQRHLNSLPVEEQVTQASIMSAPPKQMLVVTMSGKAKCSSEPSGSKAVIPPLMMVATQTLPPASTARLSTS